MNLNELTLDNIGTWPLAARAVTIGFICFVLFGLFFVFDYKPMKVKIHQSQLSENDLRATYQVKYSQVANQDAYAAQVNQMEVKIKSILQQLPEQLDVPELIGDISKAGSDSGLSFNYIKPQEEADYSNYSALPIEISVNGTYEQLTNFVTLLAKIPRIVTIDTFSIQHVTPATTENSESNPLQSSTLNMVLTAVTYKQNPHPTQEKKV